MDRGPQKKRGRESLEIRFASGLAIGIGLGTLLGAGLGTQGSERHDERDRTDG